MSRFKIYRDRIGKCRILLKSEHKIEFISEPFISVSACLKAINTIKKTFKINKAYRLGKKQSCGSSYFEFMDINSNRLLGESATCLNNKELENLITSFKEAVSTADIDSVVYSL